MVSIFFINLVIFKLRFHGPFDYLLFGRFGLRPFFMAFPWIPLLVALGGIIGGLFLLRRYDISYKKGFLALIIGLVILILSSGFLLDRIGINKKAEKFRQLRPLYQGRFIDRSWVMGEIVGIKDNEMIIVTPEGKEVKILKNKETLLSLGSDFKEGERIRVVGEWQDDVFIAKGIGKGGFPKQIKNGEIKGIKNNRLPRRF